MGEVDLTLPLGYTIVAFVAGSYMDSSKQTSKIAAITGATGAIGKAIVVVLVQRGYQVVLLARDEEKARRTLSEIYQATGSSNLSFKLVDVSNQSSVQRLSQEWETGLQVLINNAAVAPRERLETRAGIEVQFATNVLGYYWMTSNLSDILTKSAPSRVVNIASYWAGDLDLHDLEFRHRPYHNQTAYRQSKQANRMLTAAMAPLFDPGQVTINACHPGDVRSTLSASLGFGGSQTAQDAAVTPTWLATSNNLGLITGKYFESEKETYCPFGDDINNSQELLKACASYTH